MSFTDPVGDMLTRIRNGQMRMHSKIKMPASSFKGKILEVLKIIVVTGLEILVLELKNI